MDFFICFVTAYSALHMCETLEFRQNFIAWYLLGWVAKRGCGTILSGGALWRRAFLANRGKETGP